MFNILKKICLFLLLSTGMQASILLKVKNIHEIKGNLMIGIYTSQSDLDNRIGLKGYKEKVFDKEAAVEIADLKPGWYMIAVFHDVNANEKLDTNYIGIPVEPYGFSLNQMGMFGPSYAKSKFYYDGNKMNLEIDLN